MKCNRTISNLNVGKEKSCGRQSQCLVKVFFVAETVPTTDNVIPQKADPDKGARTSVSGWSIQEVCDWLAALGLAQYGPAFIQNAIDGTELLTLSDETLKTALNVCKYNGKNRTND